NIYLSFGSNVGNRQKHIEDAISELSKNNIKQIKKSSLYETFPIGPQQRKFYNLVGKFETNLSAEELLKVLKDIEKKIGRIKTFRWGPRVIDIDILFYGNKIVNLKKLVIPHKEIINRLFVLYPMNEISSNFVHPSIKKTIKTILKEFLKNTDKICKS
ncbi:MAG: 2-amino-4-hydroxy-6-hydroxymethyldihydropteridine diphosphokinase, partial [Endomicrobiia bacterium]